MHDDAAWDLFQEKGYAAVSLDEIIGRSGGSKATIYDFFGSKEGLFLELVSSVNERILSKMKMPETFGQPPREALTLISHAIMSKILSEKAIEIYRLSVSESKLFPRIGKLFFEAGPGPLRTLFRHFEPPCNRNHSLLIFLPHIFCYRGLLLEWGSEK